MENFFKDITRIADALEKLAVAKLPPLVIVDEDGKVLEKAEKTASAETPTEEAKSVKTKTPKTKTPKTPDPEPESGDEPVVDEASVTLVQVRKLSQDLQAKGVDTSTLKEIIKGTGKDTLMSLNDQELKVVYAAFGKLLEEQDL